jgi:hypothetical protein
MRVTWTPSIVSKQGTKMTRSDLCQKITREVLPAALQVAARESTQAQALYLGLHRLMLATSLTAASLAVVGQGNNMVLVPVALLLVGSIFISVFLRLMKFERAWYDCRALAENIKSLSWQYMMATPPFQDRSDEDAMKRFFARKLKTERESWGKFLPADGLPNNSTITVTMTKVRVSNLDVKYQTYIQERVRDQISWFTKQSQKYRTLFTLFLITGLVFQGLAILSTFFMAWRPSHDINLVPLAIAFSTACFAWIQLRRYQELYETYSMAAHALNDVISETIESGSESELHSLVDKVESLILQEHNSWQLRRKFN